MTLPDGQGALPPAEGTLGQASIVEQVTQEIEAELFAKFAIPAFPEEFPLLAAAELLNSAPNTVLRAAMDSGFFPESLRWSSPDSARVAKNSLDREQLLRLNRHPFVRTVSIVEVSRILDASVTMLVEIARDYNIEPAMMSHNYDTGSDEVFRSFFNADQITLLSRHVPRYNAPEHLLPESAIIQALGISPAAWGDLRNRLEIKGDWFRNAERGGQEMYFEKGEVAKALRFMGANKRRR